MLSAHKRSTAGESGKFPDRGELFEGQYQASAFQLLINIDRGDLFLCFRRGSDSFLAEQ
jgi:hypothetical protein